MRLDQCWFDSQCTVLSQLAILQECGVLSASASTREDKGAAGWQRQQQRPRLGCCCCSGSDLGSNRMLTLRDVSREGVVYLKYTGKRRNFLGPQIGKGFTKVPVCLCWVPNWSFPGRSSVVPAAEVVSGTGAPQLGPGEEELQCSHCWKLLWFVYLPYMPGCANPRNLPSGLP